MKSSIIIFFVSLFTSFFSGISEDGNKWYIGEWEDGEGNRMTITANNKMIIDGSVEGILMGFNFVSGGNIYCSLCEEGTTEEDFNKDSMDFTMASLFFDKAKESLELTDPYSDMPISSYHKMQVSASSNIPADPTFENLGFSQEDRRNNWILVFNKDDFNSLPSAPIQYFKEDCAISVEQWNKRGDPSLKPLKIEYKGDYVVLHYTCVNRPIRFPNIHDITRKACMVSLPEGIEKV